LVNELALYKLIWRRFVASQMMPALFDQTTIDIDAPSPAAGTSTASERLGLVLKFDGFLAVYEEGKDERDEERMKNGSLRFPASRRASSCRSWD
jgi:DNA topoisomerase-1